MRMYEYEKCQESIPWLTLGGASALKSSTSVEAGGDVGLSRRGRLVAVVLSSDEYELLRGARARFGEAYKTSVEGPETSPADSGFDADEIEASR